MNYLLDTHVLLWSLLSPSELPASSREIITDGSTKKFISPLSIWEVSIKYTTGKLDLHEYVPEDILKESLRLGLFLMEYSPEDLASYHRLPKVAGHKDPFDRMLIWQAIRQDMVLLSHDTKMRDYGVHGLQVA